jgi:predicted nucleic acid-binding protein
MTDQPRTPFVYVDANPIIYAVEGDDALASPINELFARLRELPGVAITSELTLAEVLPKALPKQRQLYFDLMISSGVFDLRPVSREILIDTADYRRIAAMNQAGGSRSMPKLPDAIHVVTAIRSGCKRFLSTDAGIKATADMTLVDAGRAGIDALLGELRV